MAIKRFLLALGIAFILAGLLWPWLKRMHLFHLPGDILIDRPEFKFIFPVTTMLILSAVLSLVVWLLRRQYASSRSHQSPVDGRNLARRWIGGDSDARSAEAERSGPGVDGNGLRGLQAREPATRGPY
ncbi:MAG: DUF2905 domain-containing protein [Steroidobacteraceae bacterium]